MIDGREVKLSWLVLLMFLIGGCGSASDDEEKLRQTIAAMQAAGEAGERREFMRFVAEDFGGQGYDRTSLANLIRVQLLRNQKVSATTTNIDVLLFDGGRATVQQRTLLTGGGNWLPERGQLYDIESGWRKDGDDWQLISASWEPVLGNR